MSRAAKKPERSLLRWIVAGILMSIILAGLVISRTSPEAIVAGGETLIATVRELGVYGVAAFALIQIVIALSGVFPASLSAVAAGTIYGTIPGFLLSALTTMTAASLAFRLSRSLFRPSISRILDRYAAVQSIDRTIAEDGWRPVCLLRISPIMPFSATSYALGLTRIDHRSYLIGTLASLPAMLGYVAIGALTDAGLSAWLHGESSIRWLLMLVGGAASIALTVWLMHAAIKVRAVP